MALVTAGVHKLIVAAGMAILTLHRCMHSCKRKFCGRVVKRCRTPGVHRMACRACSGKTSSNVIRIGRIVEIRLVAVDAVLVKSRKDIIDVTAYAGNGLMSSDKREQRVGMIER